MNSIIQGPRMINSYSAAGASGRVGGSKVTGKECRLVAFEKFCACIQAYPVPQVPVPSGTSVSHISVRCCSPVECFAEWILILLSIYWVVRCHLCSYQWLLVIMATKGCIKSPDTFCYVCGQFVIKKQRRNITDFVKKSVLCVFWKETGWSRQIMGSAKGLLRLCQRIKTMDSRFEEIFSFWNINDWREPGNHSDDCYFWSCNMRGR
jgi:hypothetical protein